MSRQAFRLCMLIAAVMLGQASSALADKRVALLIGNSAYQTLPSLTTPANNVAAMKAAFEKAGFDKVDTSLDLGHNEFIKALRNFEDDAKDADIVVVYYSGHGVQTEGKNFLVPVDAKLISERDLEDEAVSLERVMRSADSAKRLKLFALDASRGFPPLKTRNRCCSLGGSLASVDLAEPNVVMAFAVAPGARAVEDTQPVSPYARALASHLFKPGLDINLALRAVRDDVIAATGGEQSPWVSSSMIGEVVLAK